ncbi:MAG: CoA pyrophosphatase [Spongiibacteraceae bacterium]|nr:CoA pyrophosphatase [Spongiibacteraceae bacterium]
MIEVSLNQAARRLGSHRGRSAWWRPFARRAAVAVVLREAPGGLETLMIQRAERRGDRWSGHMAFPGGLVDPIDRSPLAAALREADEEVGLDLPQQGDYITRLSDVVSLPQNGHRGRLIVSPFVFALADPEPLLRPNYEVAATLWVPLDYLADHSNRQTMQWPGHHGTVPYCLVEERRVWGMSLRMLDELIQALMRDEVSVT